MNQDNLDKEDCSPMAGLVAVRLTDAGRHAAEAYRATWMTQVLTILLSDLVDSTRQQSELGNMPTFSASRYDHCNPEP